MRWRSSSSSLPAGVTLQEIDGGPTYYADAGLTYAANAGWDDPSFFPIGPWIAPLLNQTQANMWLDLNVNTFFLLTGDSNLSLLASNGFSAVLQLGEPGFDYSNSRVVGLLGADENWEESVLAINNTANSVQDNRFWWLQSTWSPLEFGDIAGYDMDVIMSQEHATPNATTRHFDITSCDTYYFTSSKDAGMLTQWGMIYNLGRDMTEDEGARGCHYGDMVDIQRPWQVHHPGPVFQFIENGEPGNTCNDADYILPAEMNAAAWGSIIHGARALMYFNHSFCGSNQGNNNFGETFYQTIQSGETISIYDQAKATNGLILQLASVINSPSALGYVSVSPSPSTFAGFDVMAKYHNVAGGDHKFYVFAIPRYSRSTTNQTATFTIPNTGASTVTVINESRTINVTAGGTQFQDTFATGNTVHIYRVN